VNQEIAKPAVVAVEELRTAVHPDGISAMKLLLIATACLFCTIWKVCDYKFFMGFLIYPKVNFYDFTVK
jgi:hypothetical protein